MSAIDFIYFDLGNVILNFDHDIGCQQISDVSGVTPNAVRAALFESGLEVRFEKGLIDSNQFHEEFCRLTDSRPSKGQFLIAASNIFSPNLAVFPLITQLRASGFPIGVLSNTCQAHWDYVQSRFLILRDFFTPYILSYEVRSLKPDAKIFDRAIELAGCQNQKCFFVDDKPENVDSAKTAGMDAVLYRSVPALANELIQRGVSVNF